MRGPSNNRAALAGAANGKRLDDDSDVQESSSDPLKNQGVSVARSGGKPNMLDRAQGYPPGLKTPVWAGRCGAGSALCQVVTILLHAEVHSYSLSTFLRASSSPLRMW